MFKATTFELYDDKNTYFKILNTNSMEKVASENPDITEESSEYIKRVTPKDGSCFVLLSAVSSYEYWGDNLNGDAFKEEEFTVNKAHKTFETHGRPYRQHANKDPKKSYGQVLHAAYNKRMRRVELVCEFERSKAEDICERIDKRDAVMVSMGCKVKYDICSICGKKSKTPKDYCDHLKYEMRKIYPDGRRVCAFNPNPVYFDISVVWVPADNSAMILKKVASAGISKSLGFTELPDLTDFKPEEFGFYEEPDFNMFKRAFQKMSDLKKSAEIEKELKCEVLKSDKSEEEAKQWISKLRKDEPEISDDNIDELAKKYSVRDVIETLGAAGIVMKPREFARLFSKANGMGHKFDSLDKDGFDFSDMPHSLNIPGGMFDDIMPRSLGSIIPGILGMLGEDTIKGKSYRPAPIVMRITKIIISKKDKDSEKKAAYDDREDTFANRIYTVSDSYRHYLLTLAAAYLAAKTGLLKKINDAGIGGGKFDKAFLNKPEVGTVGLDLLALPMMSMALGTSLGVGPNMTGTHSDLYNRRDKTAGLTSTPSLVASLAGPQLLTATMAAHMKIEDMNRRKRGLAPDDGIIHNALMNHPGKLGLVLSALAYKSGLL